MSIPTAHEQLLLELINRARLDPIGEAERYGIDLNQDLPAGTISTAVKAPLAMNLLLIDAARGHSQWMLATDTFSHTGEGGSSAYNRMVSAGYVFSGGWTCGENISWTGTTGTLDETDAIYNQHRNLFLSSGHRTNILNPGYVEIGTGQAVGVFNSSGTNWNASMVTENFAKTGTVANTLTGVVYADTDHDSFYSVGEGMGDITVTIDGGSSAVTYSAGGYAIANPSSGARSVTFSGAGLVASVTATVLVGGESEKLDLVDGAILRCSEDIVLGAGATGLVLLGDAGTGTGNGNANTLTGNRYANTLIGLGGNDIFRYLSRTDSTQSAMDTINDFQSGDRIEFLNMAGIGLLSQSYMWQGSIAATVAAVRADGSLLNVAVYFTDGSNGWLTVKGNGSGTSYDNTLIQLEDRTTTLAGSDLIGVSGAVSLEPTVSSFSFASSSGTDATYGIGEGIEVAVHFSKSVTVSGNPLLNLTVGGNVRAAAYLSGSGSDTLVFRYAVTSGDFDGNGIGIAADSIALNGGTILGAGAYEAILSHAALTDNTGHKVDGIRPTVTAFSSTTADGSYKEGAQIIITSAMSETVRAGSFLDVILNNGGTARLTGMTAGNILTGTYTVDAGEDCADLEVSSFSGTVLDLAGNSLSNTALPTGNNLADNKDLVVDTTAPDGATFSITSTPAASATYQAGELIEIAVSFNEALTVSGSPFLNLDIGGILCQAEYSGGSGTDTLSFSYLVKPQDSDGDGISIPADAILLNGGTIQDGAGNGANLSQAEVANLSGHAVDGLSGLVSGDDDNNTLTGGAGADLLFGLGGNDILNGAGGDDWLNGGVGYDTLYGGPGDDTFEVDSRQDRVVEVFGEGIDLVLTTVSFVLGENIENLDLTGINPIHGTGNGLDNEIRGNARINILDGGAGEDHLYGNAGNDVLIGGTGNDTLAGGNNNDTLRGDADNDILAGGSGNDTLTGDAGVDTFLFDSTLNAKTNIDILTDFVAGTDKIHLDKGIFKVLTDAGILSDANFRASQNGLADDNNDYILYNTTTGALFYDADGIGSGTAIQFATLSSSPTIIAHDFVVVSA